jgi:hypothetical protein
MLKIGQNKVELDSTLNVISCQESPGCATMCYMEISILPHAALRIKGKQMTLGIDQVDKTNSRGTILLHADPKALKLPEDNVLINGAGEYEVGGIKITGTRSGQHVVYGMNVDGVEILIGKISSLDAMQHKLKEHHIVVSLCDETVTASFLTSLASNVVIFYGEKGAEISQAFGKENVKPMPKYATTKDKLPTEVETIILE